MSDPLMERLSALPGAEPDSGRAERTRARCHTRLAAGTIRAADRNPSAVRPGLWQPAIAVLGVLYLIEALALALRVYGEG